MFFMLEIQRGHCFNNAHSEMKEGDTEKVASQFPTGRVSLVQPIKTTVAVVPLGVSTRHPPTGDLGVPYTWRPQSVLQTHLTCH